jgi:tetratricopeptide (TPR) repeat protein
MKYLVIFFLTVLVSCSTREHYSTTEWEFQKSILDSLIQNTHYKQAILMANSRIEIAEKYHINEYQRSNYYSDLGLLYQQMGNHSLSERCFNKSLSIYPDNAVANYNFGLLNRDMNRLEEAVRHFKKAIGLKIRTISERMIRALLHEQSLV